MIVFEKVWIIKTRVAAYIPEIIYLVSNVYDNPRLMRGANKVSYHLRRGTVDHEG